MPGGLQMKTPDSHCMERWTIAQWNSLEFYDAWLQVRRTTLQICTAQQ